MLRCIAFCILPVILTAPAAAQSRPQNGNRPASNPTAPIKPPDAQERDMQQRMDTMHRLSTDVPSERQTTAQGAPAVISVLDLNVPDKARNEFNKGVKELQKRDFAKAAGHFQKSLEIYPPFVAARNDLGVSYMYEGENDRAREQFESALRINARVPMVLENLGRVFLAQRHFAEAESHIKEAVNLDPRNPEALTLLAFAQLHNREFDDAVLTGRSVHEREHKNFAIVHVVVAYALEAQSRLHEAEQEYETFLKEDPGNPRAPQAQQRVAELAAMVSSPAKH